jgi:hypothetical protein
MVEGRETCLGIYSTMTWGRLSLSYAPSSVETPKRLDIWVHPLGNIPGQRVMGPHPPSNGKLERRSRELVSNCWCSRKGTALNDGGVIYPEGT